MSAILTQNPYSAPACTDYPTSEVDTDDQPDFLALLLMTVLAVGIGVATWYVSVIAFVVGSALLGEPVFTIGVCLATFLPFVFAFWAAGATRKLLCAAHRKFFLQS